MPLHLFGKSKKPAVEAKPRPKPAPRPAPKPKVQKAKPKKAAKPVSRPIVAPKKAAPEKLDDEKAYELLKAAKIPVVPYMFLKGERELPEAFKKIGFPLVLKATGHNIVHKTELGAVKMAANGGAAMAAFKELVKLKGCEKVLVQKKLEGFEMIVGAKHDPQFGTVVSVGLGGQYVEILKDVTFRVVPLATGDAASMVRDLKGYDIIAGGRGQPAINFIALYDVLVKVGNLAAREHIKEMDINPLFCSPQGCFAADVRIVK